LNADRHIIEKEFEEMLYDAHSIIFKVCLAFTDQRPENVEDLYQEIACNLWKGWQTFRHECAVKSWVYRVALNTAVNGYHSRHYSDDTRFVPITPDLYNNLTVEVDDEQVSMLYELIARLSEKEREIILLYLDGYSEKDIAEIIGKSVPAVKQAIYRIKNKMKKLYEKRSGKNER
jgi:RNA polymerase sigma-70 factor (ECF subfamily)